MMPASHRKMYGFAPLSVPTLVALAKAERNAADEAPKWPTAVDFARAVLAHSIKFNWGPVHRTT